MKKLLKNMSLSASSRVLLFVLIAVNSFSEDTLELKALGTDKKKHEFKHELKGFDHTNVKDPLAEEEHFFHESMTESTLDDDEDDVKKDDVEKDLMGFKNNHITVGMEVFPNGSDKPSIFNPFIQSFEVYKDMKFSSTTFVVGAQGRRNRIDSLRENNLLSDDFLSGSIWHKNFSIEGSHGQLDKQISSININDGAVLDTRKERTRELKLEIDLKEHIYTTVSANIFDQKVMADESYRKYRIFYGDAYADFAYDSAYGDNNNTLKFGVGFMSDALNDHPNNFIIVSLGDKFKFNNSKLEVDGSGQVGFNFKDSSYIYDIDFKLKGHWQDFDISGGLQVKDWHKRYRDIVDEFDDIDCYISGNYKTEGTVKIPFRVEYTGSQYFKVGSKFEYNIPTNMFVYEQKAAEGGAIAATQYSGQDSNWFALGFDGSVNIWKFDMSAGYNYRHLPKLAFSPAHTIDCKAEFIHAFFSASLVGEYKSEFYTQHGDKGVKLPGYFTTDLEISFDPVEHLTALIGVENLFDATEKYKDGYPLEARKFIIEVRFNF